VESWFKGTRGHHEIMNGQRIVQMDDGGVSNSGSTIAALCPDEFQMLPVDSRVPRSDLEVDGIMLSRSVARCVRSHVFRSLHSTSAIYSAGINGSFKAS
jgi:hypothetical protein